MQICISSGHSTQCQGAIGILNEVEEATLVSDQVTWLLRESGVDVAVYHDTVSTNQDENLDRIVDWHNSQAREIDVSVHFNASDDHKGHGVEVLYLTQEVLAADLATNIADVSGLSNRGAKYRDNLAVLNNTSAPCVLIEVAFCDHAGDCEAYRTYFTLICEAIADTLAAFVGAGPALPEEPIPDGVLFKATGGCSYFGGPEDMGVSGDEGLAFHYDINPDNEHLFLPNQPSNSTGLARRLNARAVMYVACRWNYDITSKDMLADSNYRAMVRAPSTGRELLAWPADWGPHDSTNRIADLSPALMEALDIETDDIVEVIYPWKDD